MTRSLRVFADIRSWLLLVLLLRLIGINNPPTELSHSWRQAFTNMVARELVEGTFDLLHPRTDMAGERADVVACEFPGLNAVMALLYIVFGLAPWYGRIVVLIISTLGACPSTRSCAGAMADASRSPRRSCCCGRRGSSTAARRCPMSSASAWC
jgi:hypothetical protein